MTTQTIPRDDLKKALSVVSPALASKDFIPLFKCFFFTNKEVYAWDDLVSIKYQLATGIVGAARGDMLLGVVGSLSEDQIELSQTGNQVTLKSGKVKLDFAVIPEDEFVFQWPKPPKKCPVLSVTKELVDAISACLTSCAFDTSSPQICGVTLYPADKGITVNSTDRVTMTSVELDLDGLAAPVLFPIDFCKALVQSCASLFNGEKQTIPYGQIYLPADGQYALADLGAVSVFCRLYSTAPLAYPEHIAKFVASSGNLIPVPKGLATMLERAKSIMVGSNPKCRMVVDQGEITLNTVSDYGDLNDAVDHEGNHGLADIFINPALVVQFLGGEDQFINVNVESVILNSGVLTNFVAPVNK